MRAAAPIALAAAVALAVPAQGAPRSLTGERAKVGAAAAPASQLQRVEERRSLGTRFIRYRQRVEGLPVLDSEIVLTDAPGTRADVLVDNSARVASPPDATVSREDAVAAAQSHTQTRRLRAPARAELAVLAERAQSRAVWRVLLPSAEPLADYEVLVDARTRRMLRVRDILRRAFTETGTTAVYDPNPVVANGSVTGLADGDDADSPLLASLLEPNMLARLNDANTCLDGQWVRATLQPPFSDVCDPARSFAYTRSDDRFEAAMAYFHVDRAQQYLQTILGITNVNARQTPVNANALPDDNSYYSPLTDDIALGSGGTDDGEDAEVVVHEYGHAIQDDQVELFGISTEAAAMGEGFSDYFAAAISTHFEPEPLFDPCIGEWDALGLSASCLRRVDGDATARQARAACDGEEHCLGEAWSAVLWDIRTQVGAIAADRAIIQSHFGVPANGGFYEGAVALISAAQALGLPAPDVAFIRLILTGRGFYDSEQADNLPRGAVPLSLPGSRTGSLQAGQDSDDVYAVDLTAGAGVVLRLRSAAADFDLRLLRPGVQFLDGPGVAVAQALGPGSNEDIAFGPPATGRYLLDVRAAAGTGAYAVFALPDADGDARPDGEDNCPSVSNPGQENSDGDRMSDACDPFPRDPENDADRDGLGAPEDNCPRASNRTQADWDRDSRGDLCDRSARVTLKRLRLRRRVLTLRATLRPSLLGSKAVTVSVERRACRRCRYRKATTLRRGRSRGGGKVDLTVRLRRAGGYRFRALLRDSRYSRVRSRAFALRLR